MLRRASPCLAEAAWHGHLSREQCLHELNVILGAEKPCGETEGFHV